MHQINAVCHDGYPTCFYRRLEDDGSLTVTVDRWFDPAAVYGHGSDGRQTLEGLSKTWQAAYEFLKTRDLGDVSSTSKRLRSRDAGSQARLGDELRELAGVLEGTHRHDDLASDLLLEGSQSLYWAIVTAVHAGIGWEHLRPDRALSTHEAAIAPISGRQNASSRSGDLALRNAAQRRSASRLHAAIALVATGGAASRARSKFS